MTNPPCAVCPRPAVKPALFGTRLCAEHRYEAAGEWLEATVEAGRQGRALEDREFVQAWVARESEEVDA